MTTIADISRAVTAVPGVEGPSPAWESTLRLFYGLPLSADDLQRLAHVTHRSPSWLASRAAGAAPMRELWARVGRRGRKSSTAALIAVFETLFGGHEAHLMPGEKGMIACISKDLAGSNVVARFAKTYLDALGITWSPSRLGNVQIVQLDGVRFDIALLASNTTAPRGWPIPVVVLDEFAHVPIDSGSDEYVNSDRGILSAVKPAMAQFPSAKLIGISTPLGCSGVFHESVEAALGSTDADVLAVEGPTWEWSPDVTEERTHELETDPDVHAREYGAQPSANEGLAFVQSDVMRCFEPRPEYYIRRQPFMIVDAAESADTFAFASAQWCVPDRSQHYQLAKPPPGSGLSPDVYVGRARDENGAEVPIPQAQRDLLYLGEIGGYDGPTVRQLGMDRVVADLASLAKSRGCSHVIGDDRAGPYLEALFSQHGVRFGFVNYANKKHEAVVMVRSWMRDGQLLIQDHAEMKSQLRRYRRFVSGGAVPFTYGQRNVRDDFACLPITLAVSLIRTAEERARPPAAVDGAPTIRSLGGRHIEHRR